MANITYESLFAFLQNLGFKDISPSELERVFEHSSTEALLAFSMLNTASEDREVRDADILSAQLQLSQHGLLEGDLREVVARNKHNI